MFDSEVRNSALPDHIQGVAPAALGADLVFVPQVVGGGSLVRNLTHTRIISPNLDGVNDEYELSFALVRTNTIPRVRIYTLDGRQVAGLAGVLDGRWRYVWDGRAAGKTVPPGVYILQIRVPADAGDETVQKLVHVAY